MDKILKDLEIEIRQLADPEKALQLQAFFKTGKGQYGEGDRFYGITVPILRKLVKVYGHLSFDSLEKLIQSPIHEERLLSLLICVDQYKKAKSLSMKKAVYDFYVAHLDFVNNWDLVDLSSHHVVGDYLYDKNRRVLYGWAKNKNLWDRRIAIVSTYYFIKRKDYQTTLDLAEILLPDKEDLIHKAAGWMLREVGKMDLKVEEGFLKSFCSRMPRTMLRYAIERFPENKRQYYLRYDEKK